MVFVLVIPGVTELCSSADRVSGVGCREDIPHISNTERGKHLDFATD